MKYQIPKMRMLSAISGHGICNNGSAAIGGECISNGSSAADGCSAGNTANVINCESGSAADQLGPDACSSGSIPNRDCITGTSF